MMQNHELIVLDEAQAIKMIVNVKIYKGVSKKFGIAVTGTPFEIMLQTYGNF
jgi:hypothetical protein